MHMSTSHSDTVENVLVVLWIIGGQTTSNASTIPGHIALPRTTSSYQEVVVDSYTSLTAGYRCVPTLSNGSLLQSNNYIPQVECECYQTTAKFLSHSDLPPTRHHLQDWGGGCEEGRGGRWTEGKGHKELHYWGWRRGELYSLCAHPFNPVVAEQLAIVGGEINEVIMTHELMIIDTSGMAYLARWTDVLYCICAYCIGRWTC